jgi:hypothetical protein
LTPNSGPNFWDGRYLGAVVESALRSRRLTSKELGHVIVDDRDDRATNGVW